MSQTEKEKNNSLLLVCVIIVGFGGLLFLLEFSLKSAKYSRPIDLGVGLAYCYLAIILAYQYYSSKVAIKAGKEFKISNIKMVALILTAIPILILSSEFLAKPIIRSRLITECEQIPIQEEERGKRPIGPLLLDYCYYNAAIQTGDVTICEKIPDSLVKENCYKQAVLTD
ncbi:MAG: hypothetical protein N3F05_03725 [Candidatus Diapherotrites archaeon]|nr:hypothetical protein [Candidatus Diapherotrites archaeon]